MSYSEYHERRGKGGRKGSERKETEASSERNITNKYQQILTEPQAQRRYNKRTP